MVPDQERVPPDTFQEDEKGLGILGSKAGSLRRFITRSVAQGPSCCLIPQRLRGNRWLTLPATCEVTGLHFRLLVSSMHSCRLLPTTAQYLECTHASVHPRVKWHINVQVWGRVSTSSHVFRRSRMLRSFALGYRRKSYHCCAGSLFQKFDPPSPSRRCCIGAGCDRSGPPFDEAMSSPKTTPRCSCRCAAAT